MASVGFADCMPRHDVAFCASLAECTNLSDPADQRAIPCSWPSMGSIVFWRSALVRGAGLVEISVGSRRFSADNFVYGAGRSKSLATVVLSLLDHAAAHTLACTSGAGGWPPGPFGGLLLGGGV